MNVLVIPEDFRTDQFILKPLVEAIFAAIEKPRARVRVCQDPLLGGIDQATNWERIREILDRYRGMVEIFLLIVDRDGQDGRRTALDRIEQQANEYLGAGSYFIAEVAWQELEVWTLAGQDLPADWSWQDIRAEQHPKERYFLPYCRQHDLLDEPGQGRKLLGKEAAARYRRVRSRCPEIAALEQRLRDVC